ncbi:hypothetical protein ES705_32570 [subsurface metagenome]
MCVGGFILGSIFKAPWVIIAYCILATFISLYLMLKISIIMFIGSLLFFGFCSYYTIFEYNTKATHEVFDIFIPDYDNPYLKVDTAQINENTGSPAIIRTGNDGKPYVEKEAKPNKKEAASEEKPQKVNRVIPIEGDSLKILEICKKYKHISSIYLYGNIPEKKIVNAIKEYEIPDGEPVLLLVDSTIFGSAKVGFALCENGVYWNTSWLVDTTLNYISWEDFSGKEIYLDESEIDFGSGIKIELTAVENSEKEQIVELLNDIQAFLNRRVHHTNTDLSRCRDILTIITENRKNGLN